MSATRVGPALGVLAVTAAVLAWWGWRDGAYFATVFYPGAMVLLALLVVLLAVAPLRAYLRGPARIALLALLLIGAWTLLSMLWTPSREAGLGDGLVALLYAAVFLLGIWACNLLGPRMALALAPVATAGVAVGVATVVALATSTDVQALVHPDATLRFPIGYRNANACFFLICVWPLLALAVDGRSAWQLRALMIGSATVLLELVVLSQSRGSVPAAAAALLAFVLLSPRRLRAGAHIGLAALPVLPALPFLLDVFQHDVADAAIVPLMRDAAAAIAVTSLASILLGAFSLRIVERRLEIGAETAARLSRVAAGVAIGAVVVGGTLFVVERGGPIRFLDQRIGEFEAGGNPDLSTQGTRFGVNVGSNRHDFWSVALEEGGNDPLLGGGAGAFEFAYRRERASAETPKDPHSMELLMFSELGLPGLLLILLFTISAALAALRSRRLGPAVAALVAGGLAGATQWFVQASYDWFWHYPALTAAALFMLGAAASPALLASTTGSAVRIRAAAAAATALVIAVCVPLFVSERYTDRAYEAWFRDPAAAFDDLDRAASLNPFAVEPLLVEGVIASRVGQPDRAVTALTDAAERQPDSYASHYLLARLLADRDPPAAREEISVAVRLNPLGPTARRLQRQIVAAAAGK
jgi:hypothetical protein